MKNVTMKYVHIFQCPKLLRSLHYLGVNFKAETAETWQMFTFNFSGSRAGPGCYSRNVSTKIFTKPTVPFTA